MSGRVVVVDYGVGNLHSVLKAFAFLAVDALASNDPGALADAGALLVPGVGAFGDAMTALERTGLVEPIRAFAATGKPVLGVCLGMQLLFDESEEFGRHAGLGLVPGRVVSLAALGAFAGKLPHVGWDGLRPSRPWLGTVLEDVAAGDECYFVHSFAAVPRDPGVVLATTAHGGVEFCSVVQKGNVAGCQFHPEKSRGTGLAILRRFAASVSSRP